MSAYEVAQSAIPVEAHRGFSFAGPASMKQIVRIVMCGSIEGLRPDEVAAGLHACRQGYLETPEGYVGYSGEVTQDSMEEALGSGATLVYGRCRTHGPGAIYNAIPPQGWKDLSG